MSIEPPSPRFLPKPYCTATDMRRILYLHAFPPPAEDDELLRACKADVAFTEVQLAECQAAADKAKASQPAPSLANHSRGYSPPPYTPRAAGKSTLIDAHKSLLHAQAVELSVTTGSLTYLVEWPMSPQTSPDRSIKKMGPLLPNVGGLVSSRWRGVQKLIREKLYASKIDVFYRIAGEGIVALSNPKMWLDDSWSHKVLVDGVIAPSFGQSKLTTEALFDTDQLRKAIPAQSDKRPSPPRSVGRPNKINAVCKWLTKNHPNGKPKGVLIKELRNAASDDLNTSISVATFKTARNAISWPKGS
ncbi:hypothetical protein OAN307_c13030 [Octadecabacter antarcticus 307]|uniref:Uncharacterized protein n=1 Tax=Octadecabacter antarcticus 307 TaxID=391626 RepID=M9R9H7_9RHOB|nr:hypothetical protein [Octadecabacter antarcticus]AGI66996.1 hypothetical protein OAN307_c13030 [Octadecabacter antarcticus 307]